MRRPARPSPGPGEGGGPTLLECKTYRYYDHVGVRGMGLELPH